MSEHNTITPRDSQTQSPWQSNSMSVPVKSGSDFQQTFDVLIVGAGITGLTTALLLQKAGQQCIVVESGNVGFGTTGGTSAHLNTFFDATYPEIESDFSEDAAHLVADSGKEAFDLITSLIDEYQINCDFEYKEAYLYSENEKESKQLTEILESSKRAGLTVSESNTNDLQIPFDKAIRFEEQGQFHPLKYIEAIAKAFVELGGIILDHTFVSDSIHREGLNITTAGGNILKSVHLVYATHIPPGITSFSFRCSPYRSYVLGATLKNGNYPKALVYDMQEPYHYFRTHEIDGQKYLIAGGEDHKTGHDDPEKAFENLESYLRQHFEVEEVKYKWSSQYYIPVDGLPYIGNLNSKDDHQYIATGFNGNGMSFGTLSAQIISDLILGNSNKYAQLYSPSRLKPVAGFSEFIKENADVAYHFVADRFSAEELESLSQLANGEGKIAELEGKKMAVYKDEDGNISALSPVCTHAGCIVSFNAAEKSWDCPCHGGRFDVSGKVISGPPREELNQIINLTS